jgi:pilus assembly protein CpaE
MSRFIAVSIDCRNDAVRRTFEEIVSSRRGYLVTKGQGTGTVDMLLLELDEFRPQQTFARVRELLGTSPELEVFLTASRIDPQLLLEAFRVGVKEFLSQPLTRQELEPALARFEERFSAKVAGLDRHCGRVVSVIGARGGVGVSTVATNMAASIQQAGKGESVALMDLDLHGGDLGLFLDLHATQGLKHLAKDLSRLDETFLRSALVPHASGLQLLASGYEAFEDAEYVHGSAMRVVGLLRSMHQHIVVDCGHVLDPAVKEALDYSDQVIVITTLSLPAIRRTKRLLETLAAAQYSTDKVRVVVNRYTSDQKDLLSETEGMLAVRMTGLIPNDYRTASEAIDHGKPLTMMAARTSISQWYLRESEQLIGGKVRANGTALSKHGGKKASFFSRYLPSLRVELKGKPSVG